MIKAYKGYHLLGLLLFIAYLLQHFMGLHWQALVDLQQQEWYRILSGLILLSLILFQWYFSRVRANPKLSAAKTVRHYNFHSWIGALSPLVFFLHAAAPGYAYLLVLSILFFGNLLLGLLNGDTLSISSQWYYQGWMILHVSLSCLITALVLVHIAVVIYYE